MTRRGSLRLVPPLLATALLLPALVNAQEPRTRPMVPQESIRGVSPGMSPAEVRSAIGRGPQGSTTAPNPILGRVRIWRFGTLRVTFDGTGAGRSVVTVTTTSTRDRTARGVGVGSSEAEVRRLVAGTRCATQYGYRHCWLGIDRAGRILTDFAINRRGRVARVTLGRVLD